MRIRLIETLTRLAAPLALAAVVAAAVPAAAQNPGGFLQKSYSTSIRPRLSQSQIQSFVPSSRGKFTFPAPYNTTGVRITDASDCSGGQDCLFYVGYSYWKNINNHVGSNTMYIFLSFNRNNGGQGPTLFSYNKTTDAVTKVGPLFDASSSWSWQNANGWYFSATQPTKLYVNQWNTPAFYRYDILSRNFDLVFDISTRTDVFGSNKAVGQLHSSDDDKVHSFTVQDASTAEFYGCGVYREDTRSFRYFPRQTTSYDECNLDATGRWLIIFDGNVDLDNRIIDLQNNTEKTILNKDGRLGHLDMGDGYMVGNSGSVPQPQATLLYQFPLATTTYPVGPVVFYNSDWNTGLVNHVSHQNRQVGVPPQDQYACGSNLDSNAGRENEIACFRLDTSYDALIVAPVMSNTNASGGGDDYAKHPKGNLDVTGQYFIWTSNMGGNRLDAFVVKVPSQRLMGSVATPPPPPADTSAPAISGVSAPLISSTGATINWSTNEASDSQVEYGPTTAYGSATPQNGGMVTSHSQNLSALAANTLYHFRVKSRDAAGNLATSADATFNTLGLADGAAPTVAVSNPLAGKTVKGKITIAAAASDDVGVAGVQFQIDGKNFSTEDKTAPYSVGWNTSVYTNGLHTVTAVARDNAGNTTISAPVIVTVTGGKSGGDKTAPTVSIAAPADGAQVSGTVAVSANAADANGIGGVQFKLDGVNLGAEDTAAPYSVSWNSAAAAPGPHTLTAVARDAAGNSATSAAITVTVSAPVDGNAPVISNVGASSITASSATIGWTTDEASDSQVEYGLTTAYGSAAALNTSMVASHAQSLAGLNAGSLYHYRVKSRDAAGNQAVSGDFTLNTAAPVSTPAAPSVENVTWTNFFNTVAFGNTLQENCGGCGNAGAQSVQTINSGNGYVEFTAAETNASRVAGLSNGNTDNTRMDIDFGIELWATLPDGSTWAEVYENSVWKGSTSYTNGDVFRIAVESGVVKYYKNGTVFYTSAKAPSYPLLVDTNMGSALGTIANAVFSAS